MNDNNDNNNNSNNNNNNNFAIPVDQSENKRKRKDRYLDLARELKTAAEQKGEGYTNYGWCARNGYQRLNVETEGVRNQWKN